MTDQDTYLQDFLASIPLRAPRKPKPKRQVAVTKYNLKQLYYDARRVMFQAKYPAGWEAGSYYDNPFPKIDTSNGLTRAIIDYLNWSGHNADRTGTQGRMIKDKRGNYKRITSANRKGTSDISATIKGRSVKLEVKVGKDTPSDDQLKEQARERAAGDVYEFVYSFDGFFEFYFNFIKTI